MVVYRIYGVDMGILGAGEGYGSGISVMSRM